MFFACSNGIFHLPRSRGPALYEEDAGKKLDASKADSAQALIDDAAFFIRGISGELPPDDDVIMAAIHMIP